MLALVLVTILQDMKSSFGTFLDPVADKLMVVTVLVMLSSYPIPAGTFQDNSWVLPCLSSGTLDLLKDFISHSYLIFMCN